MVHGRPVEEGISRMQSRAFRRGKGLPWQFSGSAANSCRSTPDSACCALTATTNSPASGIVGPAGGARDERVRAATDPQRGGECLYENGSGVARILFRCRFRLRLEAV